MKIFANAIPNKRAGTRLPAKMEISQIFRQILLSTLPLN